MCKGRGTVFMNNKLYVDLICLKAVLTLIPLLARSFFRIQGLSLLSFINNYPFPFLAQSFLRAQGLGSAESGIVLSYAGPGLSRIRSDREKESPRSESYYMYCEYLNLGRKRSSRKKTPLKKTKPKQTQFKAKQSQFFGGFWRKNFNFSLKIDDTKLNLLCKTKPICFYPAPTLWLFRSSRTYKVSAVAK